jgi:hypothetical protein
MGHYASEMDPHWGEPTSSERKLAEVEDERIKALAGALFRGFNMGPHLESLNTENGIRVAQAIDELVRARVEEALSVTATTQE